MTKPKRRTLRTVLILLFLAFVGIQFKTIDRTNPAVIETFKGSPELMAVLKRACWDCHSNETRWPWYTWVAPISWFVADHVVEGREKLNFSDWDDSEAEDLKRDIWKSVRKGEMPLPSYLWIHRDGVLSDADKKLIEDWSKSE
ncbi:MAG: heme-binding domain-containing protein [Planctomycetota bacterium]